MVSLYEHVKKEVISELFHEVVPGATIISLQCKFETIIDDWAIVEKACLVQLQSKRKKISRFEAWISAPHDIKASYLHMFRRWQGRIEVQNLLVLLHIEHGNNLESVSIIYRVLKELNECDERLDQVRKVYSKFMDSRERFCHCCRVPLIEPEHSIVCCNLITQGCTNVICRTCIINDSPPNVNSQKWWMAATANFLFECTHCQG